MVRKKPARAKSRAKSMAQSARAAVRKSEALIHSDLIDNAVDWTAKSTTAIRKTFLAAPLLMSVATATVAGALGWLVGRR